jgi:ribosomal protein L22
MALRCGSSHNWKPRDFKLYPAPGGSKTGKMRDPETEPEAVAKRGKITGSPMKLNFVARQVRGMKADEALTQMKFSEKRMSYFVYKAIRSAVINAEVNLKLDPANLYICECQIDSFLHAPPHLCLQDSRVPRFPVIPRHRPAAAAYVNQLASRKKINRHSRGRFGIVKKRSCAVIVKVRELAPKAPKTFDQSF